MFVKLREPLRRTYWEMSQASRVGLATELQMTVLQGKTITVTTNGNFPVYEVRSEQSRRFHKLGPMDNAYNTRSIVGIGSPHFAA